MMGSALTDFELFGRAAIPLHRPLIPFLKEPWTSKSKYPAILVQTFLYGIYVVLFCSCAFMLARQKVIQRTLFIASSLLFLLASADMILTLYFFFRFVLGSSTQSSSAVQNTHEPWNRILEVKFALYVVANSIASGLLISRCYTIWENKRIVIAPIALVLIATVISFVSITASQLGDKLLAASFITSAAANLSVTFLIAIGMLWTSRKVRGVIKMDLPRISNYVISLLLDSGAFYSFSIFLYLVFHTLVIDASLTQIGGIAITAMVLRNSHSCESLGGENAAFNATMTQPEMRVVGTTYALPGPQHGVRTSLTVASRAPRGDDSISIDSEYK
ncbi:hypothetical protein BDZ97DRAFT_1832956 [Flammula alnicola]|nr:hypothetical protein BDZ97DRAFT_1832956 [Flammula alnicola]